jgi:DNA-binding LytR/AlgR family response regulator
MDREQEPGIVVIAQDLHLKATMESLLNSLGYELEIYGEFPTSEEFQASGFNPDLLFMEVQPETFDEAEAIAKHVNATRKTPVIFISETKEEGFFKKVKETKPFAFLLKPIELGEIKRITELALAYEGNGAIGAVAHSNGSLVEGFNATTKSFFFTKVGNKLRRIDLEKVLYIEVEGKYSSIQLADRKFHVKASLKDLLEKFPTEHFVRVSRNFVINLERIDFIDTMQYMIKIEDRDIPVSRTYKDDLMNRIQLL